MKRLIAFCIIGLTLAGCSDNEPDGAVNEEEGLTPIARKDIKLSYPEVKMVNGKNSFALNLFSRAVNNSKAETNVVTSPHSVFTALSLAANGAEGEELSELVEALGTSDLDQLNSLNAKLIKELPALDNTAKLRIANSAWINPKLSFLEEYENAVTQHYGAGIYQADFSTKAGIDAFNKWCAENTDNLITNFLDEAVTAHIILANATLFKGQWKSAFNKSLTAKASFNATTGTQAVDMMTSTGGFDIAKSSNCTAARKRYGNGAFRMYILLPDKNISLKDYAAGLTSDEWRRIKSGEWNASEGNMYLPRFKAEDKTDLRSILAEWMPAAFGKENKYTKMARSYNPLDNGYAMITKVQHAVNIEVNETGTKAAAVTDTEMVWTSPGTDETVSKDFLVDRPFIFIIEESSTSVILFMGAMNHI